jgi:hypothetical protein
MHTRDLMAAALAGLCIAPSLACNVLPHVQHASQDSGSLSMAVFQGASVVTMGAMPFAMRNLAGVSQKLACGLLAVVLLFLNFLNALDTASRVREDATGSHRGTIERAAALNSRIAELRKSRAQVPPFTFTSAASASAAQRAVEAATQARDLECAKISVQTAASERTRLQRSKGSYPRS